MRPVLAGAFFSYPGEFLYLCFQGAAFYLPLYFLISGFLLLADYYNGRIFAAMLLSLIPFFTVSLLLRVLDYTAGSRAVDYFLTAFGVRGSSMLLGLLLVAEILLIVRLLMDRPTRRPKKMSVPAVQKPEPGSFTPVPLKWGEDEPYEGEHTRTVEDLEIVEDADIRPDESADDDAAAPPEEPAEDTHDEEQNRQAENMFDDDPEDIYEDEPDSEAVFPDDIEVEEIVPEEASGDEEDDPEDVFLEAEAAASVHEEAFIEPLDIDPSSGLVDEEELTPPRHEEELYSEAPKRGDEEELEDAAKEVWAEAQHLGLDDDFVEPAARKEIEEMEDVNEAEEFSANQMVLDGTPSLEIPDDFQDPAESSITGQPDYDSVLRAVGEMDEVEELDTAEELEEAELELDEPEIFEELMSEPELVPEVEPEPAAVPAPAKSVPPAPRKKPRRYTVPVTELLETYDDDNYWVVDDETKQAAEVLRETLEEFKIAAEVTGISRGPVITMFEILPAPGVKLSKIVNLADNIALRLAASRVRIVAPIPGKHAVGIEVPNKTRSIVSFKEILDAEDLKKSRMTIPVVLGKDITGGSRIIDLVQTPHLLIAGATGSGKSVCVNSLICSVLYSRRPDEVKMILIDPKIVELKMYNDIPHLLTPVITEPKRAFQALQYCICEMERRYSLLNALGVRDIKSYNRKVKEGGLTVVPIPYIVIVVDEFADLMATTGKELEAVISRLAAMSRAVGIHLVLATQRPSVDVITGLIKANIPSRIAFMVASKMDSRIILDNMGADKLLGKGDMLFTSAWDPNPSRIQGAFLSDDEVERVTDHVKTLGEPDYIDDEIFVPEDEGNGFELENAAAGDPLMDAAVSIVVDAGKASASYLQRRLKIGYNRAARLVEEMEDRGIVGPANGSKPREIIHIPDRV